MFDTGAFGRMAFGRRGAKTHAHSGMAMGAACGGSARLCVHIRAKVAACTRTGMYGCMGGVQKAAARMRASVLAGIKMRQGMYAELAMGAGVHAALRMRRLRETVAVIDVALLPGSTLVLDGERFTARLDGENVIDRFTGAWPAMDRGVLRIDVESAGDAPARPDGEAAYTPRWI